MQSRSSISKESSPTLVQHRIPTKERFEYILDEPIPIPTPQISNMNNSFTYSTLQEYIEGYAVLYTHQLAIYYRAGQIERSTMLTLLDIIFYDEKKSSTYYLDKLDDGNDVIQTKISLLQPMDTLLNEIMLLAGYIQFMKLKGYSPRKQTGLDIKSFIYFDQGIENQTTKYLLDTFRQCTELNLSVETSCKSNNNNNNNINNNNSNGMVMMMEDDQQEPITTNCKYFKIKLNQSLEVWNTRGVIPYNYQMAKMFPDHQQYSFYSTNTAYNMLLPKYRQWLSEFINEFIGSTTTISCVNVAGNLQLIEIVFHRDELSSLEYENLLDFMVGEFYRAFYEHKKTLKKNESDALVNSLVSLINPLLFYFIYHQPNKFNFKNLQL